MQDMITIIPLLLMVVVFIIVSYRVNCTSPPTLYLHDVDRENYPYLYLYHLLFCILRDPFQLVTPDHFFVTVSTAMTNMESCREVWSPPFGGGAQLELHL